MPAKVLFFDIENIPNTVRTWDWYEQTPVGAPVEEWNIIAISWQWMHQKKVNVLSLRGEEDVRNDRVILQRMWELLDEADIVVAHNGDKFDIKKVQARMIIQGFLPPSPFKSIDTLRVARKFKFNRNTLDYLCQRLGIGSKTKHAGWELWQACIDSPTGPHWATMEKYAKQDIVLLRGLYEVFRPWISNHPIIYEIGCPVCGSHNLQSGGPRRNQILTYNRLKCLNCGAWSKQPTNVKGADTPELRGDTRK